MFDIDENAAAARCSALRAFVSSAYQSAMAAHAIAIQLAWQAKHGGSTEQNLDKLVSELRFICHYFEDDISPCIKNLPSQNQGDAR